MTSGRNISRVFVSDQLVISRHSITQRSTHLTYLIMLATLAMLLYLSKRSRLSKEPSLLRHKQDETNGYQ